MTAPPLPLPDLVWQARISSLLKELTAEVFALTEVVLAMNERLDRAEQAAAAPTSDDPGRTLSRERGGAA